MEYNLLNHKTPEYPEETINLVMENRGYDEQDLEDFLDPKNMNELDNKLNCMQIREFTSFCRTIGHHNRSGHAVLIIVDADADGFTSGAMMYQLLKDNFKGFSEINYFVHSAKSHGITEEVMEHLEERMMDGRTYDLVIVPDAGSNNIEEFKQLRENHIEVLILDHHETDNTFEDFDLSLVNNQLIDSISNHYVGAGMVYLMAKYMEQHSPQVQKGYSDKLLPLFLIGQIGDASDISQPELRYQINKALNEFKEHNEFIHYYATHEMPRVLSFRDLSFTLIPKINAVSRVGTLEERKALFEALASFDHPEKITVTRTVVDKLTKKRPKKEVEVDYYNETAHMLGRVKNRQDALKKKHHKLLMESIDTSYGIAIATSDEMKIASLTGLVANEISKSIGKPTLVLIDNGESDTVFGSGRGFEDVLSDFKQWVNDSELANFAEGHANAFGTEIKRENLSKLLEHSNGLERMDGVKDVDIHFTNAYEVQKHLIALHKYTNVFGGELKEPTLLIDVTVPKASIKRRGTVISFWIYGVTYTIFKQNEEVFDKMMNIEGDEIFCQIIGFGSVGEFNGQSRPEVVVSDFNYEEKETLGFGEDTELEDLF